MVWKTFLYIEVGTNIEILVFLLFTIIFTILISLNFKYKRQTTINESNYSNLKIPVSLLRAHVARYIQRTNLTIKDIENMYLSFLKKHLSSFDVDFKGELKQLHFLVNNNINIEKTIKKGTGELHKKRLLILIFLFNISIKSGEIPIPLLNYLNQVYKELGITLQVYLNIKSRYIKEKKRTDIFNNSFLFNKRINAYKILACSESSDMKELKEAFRTLAKKYHPDTSLFSSEKQKQLNVIKFRKITEAYNYIKELRT